MGGEYFESKLAFHSAPALLGIKCASLVSIKHDVLWENDLQHDFSLDEQIECFNSKASAKGLEIKKLCSCTKRTLIYVFNRHLLNGLLYSEHNLSLLKRYGYSAHQTVDQMLERLSERISQNGDFPHEIGIFLGYPTEDVAGFIENKGENYKLCGCWKVYSDEVRAKKMFDNYGKCRKFLCNKLNQGINLYQALKII